MNFIDSNQSLPPIKTKNTTFKVLISISLLFLVACAGSAFYYYKQWNDLKDNPAKVTEMENKDLITRVGRLILLPTDEEPTVATVTEPDKLKNQEFFAKAKTGFKVLVYAKAKIAYLYDPSENKIINVSPINTEPTAQTSGTSTTTTPASTIPNGLTTTSDN